MHELIITTGLEKKKIHHLQYGNSITRMEIPLHGRFLDRRKKKIKQTYSTY